SYEDTPTALARQSDGKLVVAGTSFAGATTRLAVARYNADGSLDPTFGTGGEAAVPFTDTVNVAAVAVQPDGKVVVAGTLSNFSINAVNADFLLARFTAAGALDPTFDGDGLLTTDFGGTDNLAALLVQPDGKLVAAGTSMLG